MHAFGEHTWAFACACGWSVRSPTLAVLQIRTSEHAKTHEVDDARLFDELDAEGLVP